MVRPITRTHRVVYLHRVRRIHRIIAYADPSSNPDCLPRFYGADCRGRASASKTTLRISWCKILNRFSSSLARALQMEGGDTIPQDSSCPSIRRQGPQPIPTLRCEPAQMTAQGGQPAHGGSVPETAPPSSECPQSDGGSAACHKRWSTSGSRFGNPSRWYQRQFI